MRSPKTLNFRQIKLLTLFLLFNFFSFAQDIQVEITGGTTITQNEVISISSGNAITFRVTTTASNCGNLRIQDITLTNPTDFTLTHILLPVNVKPAQCRNGIKYLDFVVTNISGNCGSATDVTIESNSDPNFLFTFSINGSPEINALGGSPLADILHGSTITTAINGTYFGVVESGVSETRYYIISNTGSCALDISAISSTSGDFIVPGYLLLPNYTPTSFTVSVAPGSYVILPVTFLAPVAGGTKTSTISLTNNDNTTFTFDVSAEVFDFNIPGPGGVTADFRLWLKATRGVTKDISSKVSKWADIGTNGKDAISVTGKEPTYVDDAASNINFNPVIKFENDGGSIEQYLYNNSNGFYSQDMFIVMIPDATMTNASSRNTIFAGVSSISAGDMTGVGFGDYSSEFTNETLSYNQNIPGGGLFNGEAELNSTYSNAGIINVRNNAIISPSGQDILYNSNVLTTSSVNDLVFVNVGSIDTVPDPDVVFGTEYWLGRNYDTQGSLNGRIAEVFTFASRVNDADRQKIESYLAIKYGVTLGASTEAQKDYINSFGDIVWDYTANSGYNYHVAGIGRDSISDLNQKQSKTLNTTDEVTIGLGGIFTANSANTNEFNEDGDFLVWGTNNNAYTGTNTNSVTIASGITTDLTRIDRKWKIVESIASGSGGDVENIYIGIPSASFSSFALGTDEEYVLIVADTENFADGDIIDVIPLKSDGAGNLLTWYDFDGTKYFTFGKAPKLLENHSISIASGDFLVGEYALNLNINDFTISAWVKADAAQTSTRTIMAKGNKLQLRLNSSHQIEVMVDNEVTPRFTSTMVLNDDKWHQISFVYNSGTIFLYVDGVLDKSEQNVTAPSPNYNRFSIGAVYVSKSSITNPFLGDIDEVYVWDQGLTQGQVRFLMNQEVEKVTGDIVSGKIIPSASASNEVSTIPWNKLKAYYDFNSFYGSTVEGLTDDRNFLRLKYLVKDKSIIGSQTSPLPYVSASNGDWDTGATWSNNADQIIPNTLSLDGVTIIDWNIVELNHDITSGDRDISVLGLQINSGTLKIADPNDAQDETNSGQALTITHYLELDGVIDLVGESQLVQSEGSIIDADSGGFLERDQQGTENGFNYNYWSSSVGPIGGNVATRGTGASSTNSDHSISGVLNDGTISELYQGLLYNTSQNGGPPPPPGSPKTISTHWLYKFYGSADDINAWTKIDETSSVLAGEGFTMKGTGGTALIPISTLQNYVFKGLPYNGDITLALDKSSGDVERLIGNPYPSAIDATEFILDNISTAEGGNNANTVINGALYFWDQFGQTDSHEVKEFVGGYATYNLIGGVAAISNDVRINNDLSSGTKVPGPYIPVNQGFFVSTVLETNPNNDLGTIASVDGGNIVFKNSQRVFATELEESSPSVPISVFMKSSTSKTASNTTNNNVKDKTPTIRLMYDSPLGYHRQLVIGANSKASNGFDLGYDAFMVDVNEEDMYWLIDNNNFVIQGVKTFNSAEEYPIGLIITEGGVAKIKVDALEEIDSNFPLYIKDELTGITRSINENAFEIYLDKGVYNDRFKLVFQQTANQESEITITNTQIELVSVTYNFKSSEVNLLNKENILINDMILYDIFGNEIKNVEINSKSSVTVPVSAITGLYVVKLNTNNGIVTKKIIIDK